MPRVHLHLAELAFLSARPAQHARHLQRVRLLAPGNADLLYRCGLLEFYAGRRGMAFADWRESLSLSPRHLGHVVSLTRHRLSTLELVTSVVPPSPALLIKLVEDHYATEELAAERLVIAQRAEALLEESQTDEFEFLRMRTKIHALQSRRAEAIVDYQNALVLQRGNIELRYDLARLLAAEGRLDEARYHAEICRIWPRATSGTRRCSHRSKPGTAFREHD